MPSCLSLRYILFSLHIYLLLHLSFTLSVPLTRSLSVCLPFSACFPCICLSLFFFINLPICLSLLQSQAFLLHYSNSFLLLLLYLSVSHLPPLFFSRLPVSLPPYLFFLSPFLSSTPSVSHLTSSFLFISYLPSLFLSHSSLSVPSISLSHCQTSFHTLSISPLLCQSVCAYSFFFSHPCTD